MSFSNVNMYAAPRPDLGPSRGQVSANYNNIRADADAMSDPRLNTKGLDRGGLSRGLGQQYMGSVAAAKAYGDQLSAAEKGLLSDASGTATMGLRNQAAQEQQGIALSQLQQQQAQRQWQNQFQQYKNATDFTGGIFSNLLGGGGGGGLNVNSILSGLL